MCAIALLPVQALSEPRPASRWSANQAAAWSRAQGWLVGCNFIPSTAANQLEMWQAETFDVVTIDRELGYAEELGFNSVRVFLHDLLWEQDATGFLRRIDRFLGIADRHHIGVMFVLFDSVWDPSPRLGPQLAPRPGVHNSRWVQSPGTAILVDPARHDELGAYVKGVLTRFRTDRRVHAWDLMNEPDNLNFVSYFAEEPPNKAEAALSLLEKTFAWARAVRPRQPLTSGVWLGNWTSDDTLRPIERLQLEQSDIITFHSYAGLDGDRVAVEALRRYGRPLLCTEYMARPASTFDPVLGFFKEALVGAYHWGLVAGRTQTVYPWDSWLNPYENEPAQWFHDVLHPDGSPFDRTEVSYIRKVTRSKDGPQRHRGKPRTLPVSPPGSVRR